MSTRLGGARLGVTDVSSISSPPLRTFPPFSPFLEALCVVQKCALPSPLLPLPPLSTFSSLLFPLSAGGWNGEEKKGEGRTGGGWRILHTHTHTHALPFFPPFLSPRPLPPGPACSSTFFSFLRLCCPPFLSFGGSNNPSVCVGVCSFCSLFFFFFFLFFLG
jgi:hypothetical protein